MLRQPDGTSLVLAADAKVEVKVKVEPITTKTFEVDASAFTLENIPDATKAKITEDTIQVEVTGAESDIKKLSADDITGTVNLQGYGMVNIISLQILMWIMNFIR